MTAAAQASARPPLLGVRIVDTADEKGELCGRLLADLGADVVRVEPPDGARSRHLPPFGPDGLSLSFVYRNANKRGVGLDLGQPDDRPRFEALLAGADVWIESSPPGELTPLGSAPEAVLARHPHLVITSVTDFGQDGPYRDYLATDAVILAMSGLLHRAGAPGEPPLLAPGALAYDVAGLTAACATLAALWQRLRTGRGQHLDVAALEAAAQIGDWALPNASATVAAGGQYSMVRAGSGPVYPVYPCADGYVRLIVLSPRQWRAMRDWLGDPPVLRDDFFDSLLGRMAMQDVIDGFYLEHFAHLSKVELCKEAQRRGISATPVLRPREVLDNEHLASRGTFLTAEVAPGVVGPVASGFFELDGIRCGFRTRAPLPGEHDAEVFDALDRAREPASASSTVPSGDNRPYPFEGLRVLDFGIGGVGVEAGRFFAEYGADVVKIETRSYPDFIRVVAGSEMSASFASSNRSKRSFGVNARTEAGLELVRRLVALADIVIENSSTGTMDALGLGYDTLRELNPRIVMVSSQLLGARGAWSDWIGYGPSTRTIGGMTHLWNVKGREDPIGAGVIHPDHFCGRLCALGVLAALWDRERTGKGAHVEVAQVEAVTGLLGDLLLAEHLAPGSVVPRGNESDRGAPWGVYPCAGEEQWCVITVRDDEEWGRLRAVMGDPEWARKPAYRGVEGRCAARDVIDRHLAEWTRVRTNREVMEQLQAARVPAGMMTYPTDQLEDPHFLARGYLRPVEQPDLGSIVLEGPAWRATRIPEPITRPAPRLGADTRAICTTLLGLDEHDVDRLIAERVLEVPPEYAQPA